MPIRIPDGLPAKAALERENIFVTTKSPAAARDLKSVNIAILNLMPTKMATELQLLRLLGSTPFYVNVDLISLETHVPKNTSAEHMRAFYKPFSAVRSYKYDGLIITGAPVEHLEFNQVDYWGELCQIMDWSMGTSVLHICWGAQAGIYYHYGINKVPLSKKISGIYAYDKLDSQIPLLRGFDDSFLAPHSCWTTIDRPALEKCRELKIPAVSPDAKTQIAVSENNKQIFVFSHMEYSVSTIAEEYFRDLTKGMNPAVPHNYFPDNNPNNTPPMTWRAHANLLFLNWLNYYT